MSTDNYKAVLADLRAKRKRLDDLITGLELFAGSDATPTKPSKEGGHPIQAQGDTGTPADVRADTFFGMNIPDATKKFLEIRKRPAKAKDIANGLEAGGVMSQAKNFYANVSTALRRLEAAGEVVRIGDTKKWALAEWYPGRPKTGKPTKANGEAGGGAEEGGAVEDSAGGQEGNVSDGQLKVV